MPCNSDHMRPTGREMARQEAAQLFCYALEKLKRPVPKEIRHEAANIYSKDGTIIERLCSLIGGLSAAECESLVYDAHSSASRALADWWEYHQKMDAELNAGMMPVRLGYVEGGTATPSYEDASILKPSLDDAKLWNCR